MSFFKRRAVGTAPLQKLEVTADYAGRLAFIGRRLDVGSGQSIAIIEVADNYIIRTIDPNDGTPDLIELVSEDFQSGDLRMVAELDPASYETVLTAIGTRLDEKVAFNVAIVEAPSAFHIVGWELGGAGDQQTRVRFEEFIDRDTLQELR